MTEYLDAEHERQLRAMRDVDIDIDALFTALDTARVVALREAGAAAIAERLTDDTGQPEDVAYNRAIDDVTAALTRLAYGERSDEARAFFQPGRTYQREHHGAVITFKVSAVSTSPDGRTTVAHGWRTDWCTDWEPTDSDDMTGWVDVTEDGGR